MWADFWTAKKSAEEFSNQVLYTRLICGRGYQYCSSLTDYILNTYSSKKYKVRGIFRGHQHGDMREPMMQRIWNTDKLGYSSDADVGKIWIDKKDSDNKSTGLWEGIVCTFAVTPEGYYGAVDNEVLKKGDAFGVLRLSNEGFKNWDLKVVRLNNGKPITKNKHDDKEEENI